MEQPTLIKILTTTGLAGALIFQMYIHWNVTSNHIEHNTEAFNKNTAALTKLESSIDNNNNIIQDNTSVLSDLKWIIELRK